MQFEACSYGVPCTNPTQKWRRKLFYTGMKEIGKARVKKENMLSIRLDMGLNRGSATKCWMTVSRLLGHKGPLSHNI